MAKDPNKVRSHAALILAWLSSVHDMQQEFNLTESDASFDLPGRVLLCAFSLVPKHDGTGDRWYVRIDVRTNAVILGEEDEEEVDPDFEKEEILLVESADGRTMVFGADSAMRVVELVHSNLRA